MNKYRVRCRPDVDDIYIEVEAKDAAEAKELAEEKFMNGDYVQENDPDISGLDTVTAISTERIKEFSTPTDDDNNE